MVHSRLRSKAILALFTLVAAAPLRAQTIEDGLMMPKRILCTGFLYTHDSWDEYWEGELKRDNGNVGTLTTQAITWMGNYGVTDRLNLIAMVPYVWTNASQGVLQGLDGVQDLTVAAKYNLLETPLTRHGTLRTILVGSFGTPLGDYTPDFMPMSIGSSANRFTGRLTLMWTANRKWFVHATGGYTWRGKVTLDRPSYFTDGELYMSDEVAMPDVFDYTVSAGYLSGALHVPVSFSQQITRGGGDIRRQDMPFVSNRMNYQRAEALAMYYLPSPKGLSVRVAGTYFVNGRNVGQSTAFTGGLMYAFKF